MQPFNEYITGRRVAVARQELNRLTTRYEWFTTARRARMLITGADDPGLTLPLMFSPTIPPSLHYEHLNEGALESDGKPSAADEIIGRFLEHGAYRIVPDDSTEVDEALTSEIFDDSDGELATEELADIYRSQGLNAEAKEIYRKLSLLNPEKSIYFADVIARIDIENEEITK